MQKVPYDFDYLMIATVLDVSVQPRMHSERSEIIITIIVERVSIDRV